MIGDDNQERSVVHTCLFKTIQEPSKQAIRVSDLEQVTLITLGNEPRILVPLITPVTRLTIVSTDLPVLDSRGRVSPWAVRHEYVEEMKRSRWFMQSKGRQKSVELRSRGAHRGNEGEVDLLFITGCQKELWRGPVGRGIVEAAPTVTDRRQARSQRTRKDTVEVGDTDV